MKITAMVQWNRKDAVFTDNRYSRAHEWQFDGGQVIHASSSPDVVPVPFSDPANVDPEEAFVVSLSSCHMLWFLSIAAKQNLVVDEYRDLPIGFMTKDEVGKLWVSEVVLKPKIRWCGDVPSDETVSDLHHRAHEECFLARSVRTRIRVTS